MAHNAVITCDREGCAEREAFSPVRQPPSRWLVLAHDELPPPVYAKAQPVVSTFCSVACLAAWAYVRVPVEARREERPE